MATRLSLNGMIAEGNPTSYEVEEDFEAVVNKVAPLQAESSQLEMRQNMTYTQAETGKKVFIHRNIITVVEEL